MCGLLQTVVAVHDVSYRQNAQSVCFTLHLMKLRGGAEKMVSDKLPWTLITSIICLLQGQHHV